MDSREPHQQPQLPNMMVGPTSYPSMLAPATARFPFINTNHHHHNHNPPPPPPPPPPEPLNDINNNNTCEAALKPCALGVGSSESSKKKRGRPRKYSPDGNIALGLVPNHAAASSAEPPAKKHRGRPPGSGKKQMDALGISFSILFAVSFHPFPFTCFDRVFFLLSVVQESLELVSRPMLYQPKLARYILGSLTRLSQSQ